MTRVALPLGIVAPVTVTPRRAPIQWVPPRHSLDHANRRNHKKINEGQNDSRGNVRKSFSQFHPGLIGIDERARKDYSQQYQDGAEWQCDLPDRMELAAINPPSTKQQK